MKAEDITNIRIRKHPTKRATYEIICSFDTKKNPLPAVILCKKSSPVGLVIQSLIESCARHATDQEKA